MKRRTIAALVTLVMIVGLLTFIAPVQRVTANGNEPVVTNVWPSEVRFGANGTVNVIIYGSNFWQNSCGCAIRGVKKGEAVWWYPVRTYWTPTAMSFDFPRGAHTGALWVCNYIPETEAEPHWATNRPNLVVDPTITSLSSTSGYVGDIISVNGDTFGISRGTSYVTFNNVKATSYPSWAENKIRVKVPAGIARTASVTVHVSGEGTCNTKAFKVKPKITSLSPTSGKRGSKVTITGTAFAGKRYNTSFYVKFGDTKVSTYYSWSNTAIVVKVPSASYGQLYVRVTTTGGTSPGKLFTVKR